MKGKRKVIAHLQKLLAGELTAIDQYFIHSRMYEDRGLTKLYERLDHETEEERDYQTREILEVLLRDTEEDHVYWLEKQLGLIDKVGLKNYLQSQM